jgi:hypothetical protein
MSWLKVDDKLHDHRKIMRLLRSGADRLDPGPLGLWLLAATWSADNRTDGFVPDYLLDRWDSNATEHAGRLIEAGLWRLVDVDGETGFEFHDWADYQPLKQQLEADAEVHRRKVEMHRDPRLIAAVRERDQDRCRYCGVSVDFRDRRSSTGGTYDHVDPDGSNTFDNVVVACRGCNSAKGRRTPTEWGRPLLRPGAMSAKKGPGQSVSRSSGQNVSRSSQKQQGSRAGRAGPGTGRVGPGSDPDLDPDLDTGAP